jgi:hypothetical protein
LKTPLNLIDKKASPFYNLLIYKARMGIDRGSNPAVFKLLQQKEQRFPPPLKGWVTALSTG